MRVGQNIVYQNATATAIDSTGSKLELFVTQPIQINRFGYVATNAIDNTPTSAIVALQTDTAPGAGAYATQATLTEAVTDRADGDVVQRVAYGDGPASGYAGDYVRVASGGAVRLNVTTACVAGDVIFFIEYTPLPIEQNGNAANGNAVVDLTP